MKITIEWKSKTGSGSAAFREPSRARLAYQDLVRDGAQITRLTADDERGEVLVIEPANGTKGKGA